MKKGIKERTDKRSEVATMTKQDYMCKTDGQRERRKSTRGIAAELENEKNNYTSPNKESRYAKNVAG